MDIRLQQGDDGLWSISRAGTVIHEGLTHEAALATISDELLAEVVDAANAGLTDVDAGLLEEEWESPVLCLTAATGPHRTFENVTWDALDPATQFMALWLSTTQEGGGHLGARLAGFFTQVNLGPTPSARGRFFDNDAGEQLRDMLLGGRRFGISADPTEEVTYESECLQMDPDGMYCVEDRISFLSYQIGGATATPSPGFPDAYMQLVVPETVAAPDPDEAMDEPEPVAAAGALDAPIPLPTEHNTTHADAACCDACARAGQNLAGAVVDRRSLTAAGSIPVEPPAAWFDDPRLDQLSALTITPEGQVFGHLCGWDDCHSGYVDRCVRAPHSLTGYAYFRLGAVICDDGSEVATGRLTLGGGHADRRLSFRAAIEHYDATSSCVADVACGEDEHGIWLAGALRPDVTPEQIRALRGSSPSGDWRPVGAGLELVLAHAVNQPGFATPRMARVASGGRVEALIAAGVRPVVASGDDGQGRLEREVADLRRVVTAPMRDELRGIGLPRLRERLRAGG